MIQLDFPWALALLPLPVFVRWLLAPAREFVTAIRLPFFRRLADALGTTPKPGAVVLRRRRIQMGAAILAWLLLVAGLARPTWLGVPIEREQPARDVMLAVDLSGSMDEVDFPGSDGEPVQRLEAVKRVLRRFVAARQDDRVGLIVFGTKPFVQAPFTTDLEAVSSLIDSLAVGMAGPHTALGDAIGLSIQSFQVSEVPQRLLILLTDGADTNSRMPPADAAAIAARNEVEIFTIGVGNAEVAEDADRVDFATLQQIAETTSGRFFSATDENALAVVYERIDALAPRETAVRSYRPRRSLVYWPAGLLTGLVFATYALLLLLQRARTAR
jgi:Ca-activated chloride channel family protein